MLLATALFVFVTAGCTATANAAAQLTATAIGTNSDYFYPLDFGAARQVRVENTGDRPGQWSFDTQVVDPAGNAGPSLAGYGVHPQNALVLDPGEVQTITNNIDWISGFNVFNGGAPWEAGQVYPYKLRLTFSADDGSPTPPPFEVPANIHVVAYPFPANLPAPNATISGRITLPNGRPVARQQVRVWASQPGVSYNTTTTATGAWSVRVPARARPFLGGSLTEYVIDAVRPGFRDARAIVLPAPGTNLRRNFTLRRRTLAASYRLVRTYDTQLPVQYSDASANGRYLVTTPFHSGLPHDVLSPKAYMHVFRNDGRLLWRYHLGNEVTSADMSPDGSRIAVQRPNKHLPGQQSSDGVMMFSRAGGPTPLWTHADPGDPNMINGAVAPGPSTIRMSHDMTRLAYGTYDGRAYMLATSDLRSAAPTEHRQLWEATGLEGSVRHVQFAPDDSAVYMSSGDGYIYALDAETGRRLWRSYIGTWATVMEVVGNRIYASSKVGLKFEVIDRLTGDEVWTYPTDTRLNSLSISRDGRRIAVANSSAGSIKDGVFDTRTRRLRWGHGGMAETLAFSPDSKLIAGSDGFNAYVTTADGDVLWKSPTLNSRTDQPTSAPGGPTVWSPDKRRFVTAPANFTKVYFFTGSVRRCTPSAARRQDRRCAPRSRARRR